MDDGWQHELERHIPRRRSGPQRGAAGLLSRVRRQLVRRLRSVERRLHHGAGRTGEPRGDRARRRQREPLVDRRLRRRGWLRGVSLDRGWTGCPRGDPVRQRDELSRLRRRRQHLLVPGLCDEGWRNIQRLEYHQRGRGHQAAGCAGKPGCRAASEQHRRRLVARRIRERGRVPRGTLGRWRCELGFVLHDGAGPGGIVGQRGGT